MTVRTLGHTAPASAPTANTPFAGSQIDRTCTKSGVRAAFV
eukprot:CAMPEP_0119425814 /NCGR_PEP_ID=MMETSP1335-20130426/35145_1 /TAXON_ID=259385 /ORGANISM="Chrysoculter rhomboideus, Strain RCC1486" /LENGTH=40 /DNA_ID= /DNA_START= /DNA_END= /DNA_ORIENTATION=